MTERLRAALGALEAAAQDVDAAGLPALLGELRRVEAVAWARLAGPAPTNGSGGDRLLTLDQAAERLGTFRDWLRRQKMLPFRVEVSPGQVRYSTHGIERFIARRAGK